MSIYIRILLIIGAGLVLLFMLKKIRQSKLKIEYVRFCFSSVLLLMGIFSKIVSKISAILGFQSPVNMVFLIVIFILIIKLFFNTIQISALENKVDSLAQQIAIDRKMDHDLIKDNVEQ